jgi:hypothetical protein
VLEAIALGDADLGDRRLDKVFAFNVAPFWQQPEAALGAVREHLAPDGAVYLFWDARHCAPERARDLGNELADRLREGGFSVNRVLVEDLRPVSRGLRDGAAPARMNTDRNTVSFPCQRRSRQSSPAVPLSARSTTLKIDELGAACHRRRRRLRWPVAVAEAANRVCSKLGPAGGRSDRAE